MASRRTRRFSFLFALDPSAEGTSADIHLSFWGEPEAAEAMASGLANGFLEFSDELARVHRLEQPRLNPLPSHGDRRWRFASTTARW